MQAPAEQFRFPPEASQYNGLLVDSFYDRWRDTIEACIEIAHDAWEANTPISDMDEAPWLWRGTAGLYFVFYPETRTLCYVGKSTDIRRRMNQHRRKKWWMTDEMVVGVISRQRLRRHWPIKAYDDWERWIIHATQPKWNTKSKHSPWYYPNTSWY